MGTHCLSEALVAGEARLIERLQVDRHEPLPLLVRDFQVSVNVDNVLKGELGSEGVRAAEGLGSEPGQTIDVMRLPLGEYRLEHRIRECLRIEHFLQAMDRLFAPSVLV